MRRAADGDRLWRLLLGSVLAGLGIGVLGTLFRLGLGWAQGWREALSAAALAAPGLGFAATVGGVALAAMLARWMVVRFAPIAGGSGVQHVEAVMRGEATPAPAAVVPVKFFGGLLAIGAGLPLGREGPTVQMGSVAGSIVATRLVHDEQDRRAIMAAGAGAGLGVAFNAPVGATVFVFEELTRRFDERQVFAVLAAAWVAVALMRQVLGDALVLDAGQSFDQPLGQLPFHMLFGAALGLVGGGYSWLTVRMLDLAEGLRRIPSVLRAGLIGGVIGAVGWYLPVVMGGGEDLAFAILTQVEAPAMLLAIIALRFVLGPLAYAAGTPGGLFAPLLVLGAACGALAAGLVPPAPWVPAPQVLAIIGMAALFTAVVRAPLTGIVLVIEMTGRADCALPMLAACLMASVTATLIGSRPIYNVLRERMLAR
jgi:CIC family chloride channel protein